MRPAYCTTDVLLCCFAHTTCEDDETRGWTRLWSRVVFPLLCVLALVVLAPLTTLGFILWFAVSITRRQRFEYSVRTKPSQRVSCRKRMYTFVTSNVCLLPEFAAKMENISGNKRRARAIGNSIVQGQRDKDHDLGTNHSGHSNDSSNKQTACASGTTLKHDITTTFPLVDFLLIQEAFDKTCSEALVEELHKIYPYTIYNATYDSLRSNVFLLNSGLLVASRYPIVDASFEAFPRSVYLHKIIAKGCLNVKVSLGRCDERGGELVGYLANTHLQAYKGTDTVQYDQLDLIHRKCKEFRESTLKHTEQVAFDIVGGDFNLDNMSPVDKAEYNHPLFNDYLDICRVQPGLDHDWTIGTEHRYLSLHDPTISTPGGLQDALRDPYRRQYFIYDADLDEASDGMHYLMPSVDAKTGQTILSPVGGKRRIDLLIFRECDGVQATEYRFVTQLAGMTDHIPICLTLQTTF